MRRFHPLRSAVLALLLAGNLPTWVGCGGGIPATGTMGNPVDLKQGAEQGRSAETYYKTAPKNRPKPAPTVPNYDVDRF